MNPSVLSPEDTNHLKPSDYTTHIIGAPTDELLLEGKVAPVEAIIYWNESLDNRAFAIKVKISDEEIEMLKENGGVFWMHQIGSRLSPFHFGITEDGKVDL